MTRVRHAPGSSTGIHYDSWDIDPWNFARFYGTTPRRLFQLNRWRFPALRGRGAHTFEDFAHEVRVRGWTQTLTVPYREWETQFDWDVSWSRAGDTFGAVVARADQDPLRRDTPAVRPALDLWQAVSNWEVRERVFYQPRQPGGRELFYDDNQRRGFDHDPTAAYLPEGTAVWIPFPIHEQQQPIAVPPSEPHQPPAPVPVTVPEWLTELRARCDGLRERAGRLQRQNDLADEVGAMAATALGRLDTLHRFAEVATIGSRETQDRMRAFVGQLDQLKQDAHADLGDDPIRTLAPQLRDTQIFNRDDLTRAIVDDRFRDLSIRALREPQHTFRQGHGAAAVPVPIIAYLSDSLHLAVKALVRAPDGDTILHTLGEVVDKLLNGEIERRTATGPASLDDLPELLHASHSPLEVLLKVNTTFGTSASAIWGDLPGPASLSIAVVKYASIKLLSGQRRDPDSRIVRGLTRFVSFMAGLDEAGEQALVATVVRGQQQELSDAATSLQRRFSHMQGGLPFSTLLLVISMLSIAAAWDQQPNAEAQRNAPVATFVAKWSGIFGSGVTAATAAVQFIRNWQGRNPSATVEAAAEFLGRRTVGRLIGGLLGFATVLQAAATLWTEETRQHADPYVVWGAALQGIGGFTLTVGFILDIVWIELGGGVLVLVATVVSNWEDFKALVRALPRAIQDDPPRTQEVFLAWLDSLRGLQVELATATVAMLPRLEALPLFGQVRAAAQRGAMFADFAHDDAADRDAARTELQRLHIHAADIRYLLFEPEPQTAAPAPAAQGAH